jgi:hypothetical protein
VSLASLLGFAIALFRRTKRESKSLKALRGMGFVGEQYFYYLAFSQIAAYHGRLNQKIDLFA